MTTILACIDETLDQIGVAMHRMIGWKIFNFQFMYTCSTHEVNPKSLGVYQHGLENYERSPLRNKQSSAWFKYCRLGSWQLRLFKHSCLFIFQNAAATIDRSTLGPDAQVFAEGHD